MSPLRKALKVYCKIIPDLLYNKRNLLITTVVDVFFKTLKVTQVLQ